MLFKYVQVLSVLLVAGRALHLKLAKELGVRFSSKAKLGLQAAQRFPKFLDFPSITAMVAIGLGGMLAFWQVFKQKGQTRKTVTIRLQAAPKGTCAEKVSMALPMPRILISSFCRLC